MSELIESSHQDVTSDKSNKNDSNKKDLTYVCRQKPYLENIVKKRLLQTIALKLVETESTVH